jgi:hypothetical protein
MTRRMRCLAAALLAAAAGGVIALVQLRDGVIPMLDTVTYWSGIRAVAEGRPFTTTLAPSFSNFDAVEFVIRDGRLPFVDFPVGYPLLGGLIATVTGAEPAMVILAALSSMVLAAGVVVGPTTVARSAPTLIRVAGAVGLLLLPAHRLVTQAALSEPLFTAVVVSLAVALARYRRTGSHWRLVVVLAIASGLLRFIGAPLAVLVGLERYRRERSALRAIAWTLAMMFPAAIDIAWAAVVGGGHSAGWRGLSGDDVEVFVRSVGGWLSADQGDLRLTYFGGVGPAWWAWPVAVAWLAGLVVATLGTVAGSVTTRRLRWRLPASIEIPWTMAAVITTGLLLGMLGFDALVIPDNRLMLPTGILTLAGPLWWATEVLDRRRRLGLTVATATVATVWIAVAAAPTDVTEVFSDPAPDRADIAAVIAEAPTLVIANDADGMHWATGLPSAYAPLPLKALTGEVIDVEALLAALPCPLDEAGGVVVMSDQAFLGSDSRAVLDALAAAGRLEAVAFPAGVLYRPGDAACS